MVFGIIKREYISSRFGGGYNRDYVFNQWHNSSPIFKFKNQLSKEFYKEKQAKSELAKIRRYYKKLGINVDVSIYRRFSNKTYNSK